MVRNRKTPQIDVPNALVEGCEKVEKTIDDNSTILSERTFSLASGGLVTSFSIISYIIEHQGKTIGVAAICLWMAYLICILLDCMSLFYAQHQAEKQGKEFRDLVTIGTVLPASEVNAMIDVVNRKIKRFNLVVFCLLFASIVATAIYVYSLLK